MICDLRVVAPEAYFQFPIAKYGLALDNWSIRRLTSLVGYGRARGMLLAAEKLDAQTSRCRPGMANRIGDAGRCAGLGRRDRRVRAAVAAARQAGAQRRRRLRGAVAGAQGTVRQGVGQPGRHRGAGRAHREAAAELPGRLTARCVRRGAAIRGRDGASLAAGGWVLRALHGAPAALGAGPGEIGAGRRRLAELPRRRVRQPRARRRRSAWTPRSSRLVLFDLFGQPLGQPPAGPIPLADARRRWHPRR